MTTNREKKDYRVFRRFLNSLFFGWGVVAALLIFSCLSSGSPGGAVIVGLIGLLFCWHSATSRTEQEWLDSTARGRKLKHYDTIAREAERIRDASDPGILWGDIRIPSVDARSHFCVVGAVGSGKTLTLRMLMKDQLPLITKGSDRRALIYDAKQDMVSVIESLNLSCPYIILNPFDERGVAWDLAADIQGATMARQFATTLVPEEEQGQRFFSDAVRELLTAVIEILMKRRPNDWTLRQVLLIMQSKLRLRELLKDEPRFATTVENFLDCGETTLTSIMATISTKLGPYEPIAAAWDNSKHKFSIIKWLRAEGVLILGNDERIRSTLDSINQIFVSLVSQHALTMSESNSRMTWCFFDEFREAGKLSGLLSLVLRGRSKGCCVVLGFQDIQGVHEIYGEKLGNELVGQCGNKALLRIESDVTAEWASKAIGDQEKLEAQRSSSSSGQGTSNNITYQIQKRAQVIPSQFMELPVTNHTNGLWGYYIIRSLGVYYSFYQPERLSQFLGTIDDNASNYIPRDIQYQSIEPWSEKDATHLHMQIPTPKTNPNNSNREEDDRISVLGRLSL